MTDRELLKEARDLIVMCSLLDKSNQCNEMVDKLDKQLSIPVVVLRSEQLCDHNWKKADNFGNREYCSKCYDSRN